MKNLWIKQYLSKIKHNSKLVDMMSLLFTTNVMAEESKYFLFSLSEGLSRCMFTEATKIMQLSYNSSCNFFWFLSKIFLQNVNWQTLGWTCLQVWLICWCLQYIEINTHGYKKTNHARIWKKKGTSHLTLCIFPSFIEPFPLIMIFALLWKTKASTT